MRDTAPEGEDVAPQPFEQFVERLAVRRRRSAESVPHLRRRRASQRRHRFIREPVDEQVDRLVAEGAHCLGIEPERIALHRYVKEITLRIPSCASISSKPRFTSSSDSLCETNGSTSISPASQRSTSCGTWSRPLTPPNDEPATRRPVMRKRGTTLSVSPLPATPQTVARPQPIRADSTA